MVAAMESLPVLLQMAFFRSLSSAPGWDDVQRLGNLSFAMGTYRLFTDKPEDMAAFIEHNPQNVVRVLEALTTTLKEITDLVRNSDALTVAEAFESTSEQYKQWRTARFTNKWKEEDNMPSVPNPGFLGPLGGKLLNLGGKKQKNDPRR
jgi:prephenate dehydrogenase